MEAHIDELRKIYDGPLAIAREQMVINLTKDNIELKMAVVDGDVLPPGK
jgi:ribonuclease Z